MRYPGVSALGDARAGPRRACVQAETTSAERGCVSSWRPINFRVWRVARLGGRGTRSFALRLAGIRCHVKVKVEPRR